MPSPPSEMTTSRPSGSRVPAPSSAGQRTSIPWAANRARGVASQLGRGLACGVREQADRARRLTGPTTRERRGRRRRGPGRGASHRTRNSTLPSAPRNGDDHDVDHVDGPRRAGRRAPRASTARWTSGSRTIPPLPSRARPASNCGFTRSTRSPSDRRAAGERGRDREQRDERQVGDGDVDRAAEVARLERADVRALPHACTRGSWRSDHASCPRPTSTACTCAAPACSRQSVNPPVDAPASRTRRPRTSTREARERGGELLAAAGDEAGCGRRSAGSARPRPPAGPGPGWGSRRRGRVRPRSPRPPDGGSRATPGARARRRVAGALSPAQDMPDERAGSDGRTAAAKSPTGPAR